MPRLALAALVTGLALGCSAPDGGTPPPGGTPPAVAAPSPSGIDPAELHRRGEEAGIHNFKEVAPGLFRGAQPEGDAAFALLASLGVKTMLSVDGARPDAEAAARHGIRYIHVPIEYAGITPEQQLKIARTGQRFGNGLFVHCHHGKHRGPAALAVAWITRDGVANDTAVADMVEAGCDPRYEGLYAQARSFVPPSAAALASVTEEDLPSAAAVAGLTEAMVSVDAHFSRMKAVEKAGWRTPTSHPDVVPAHESRIFAEVFRELARTDEVRGRAEDFRGWIRGSEEAAWAMEKALRAGDEAGAKASLAAIADSCNACHEKYRNRW